MSELYIGLMSGTSADGIDAALIDFSSTHPVVMSTHYTPYTDTLRKKIHSLTQKGEDEIERLGELDRLLGKAFAGAANQLLQKKSLAASAIKAIGCHGQTIRHHPHHPHRFTLQIGDPNIIAAETGITTVADFRRKDLALGGQGAPLVPAFHQAIFASNKINRAIVNIGGIANVTLLSKKNTDAIIGFDTGPGNSLMDAWVYHHHKKNHDDRGEWAATGNIQAALLEHLLEDPYFQLPAPKSTGTDYFNLDWLQKIIHSLQKKYTAADVQATLAELTVQTIARAIQSYFSAGEILICGGGVHNIFLISRLQELSKQHFIIQSTQSHGIDPDWMEAMAFAWLARQTLNRQPGNLPSVTGARQAVVLGGVYY